MTLSRFTSKRDLVRYGALVLLCLAVFFFRLGERALWDRDEGMHAFTSRVMVETGDWIVPQFNGEPFYDKPAAYNWLVAVSFLIFGFTEFASRLPSAVLGLATVLLTFGLGRRTVGAKGAFLGAIVLACSMEFVLMSRVVVHDILLTFAVTLSLLAFYRAYSEERHRGPYLLLAYASIGLSVLAKGPVGIVLTVGTVFMFLLWRRDLRFILKMMPVRGTTLAAAIGLSWYVVVALRDPQFAGYFAIQQNIGNFLPVEPRHPEPFYYYLLVLAAGFLPWVCYLVPIGWRLVRRRVAIDAPRIFLVVWFGFILLFFSAAASKLGTYILPLFPAASLLVGDFWAGILDSPQAPSRKSLVYAHAILVGLMALALPLLWINGTESPLYNPDAHFSHMVAITAIFIVTLVVGAYTLWKRRYRSYFASVAAFAVVPALYLSVFIAPVMDPYRSAKELALRLDPMLPPGEKIVSHGILAESALFYTGREGLELMSSEEVEDYFRGGGSLLLVHIDKLHKIEDVQHLFRIIEQHGNKAIAERVAP